MLAFRIVATIVVADWSVVSSVALWFDFIEVPKIKKTKRE